MEIGMDADANFWSRRRVLLTGHTGFKGSWLSLWLQDLGAELHGFSLEPPTQPALFDVARVKERMASSVIGDVRDFDHVVETFDRVRPEIVIHMAAQPLVRLSYQEPVATYATNVMGTIHVLEAARRVDSVRAMVNVTSDKCYENKEWLWGYREDEMMGGHDPYSSSKGCSELVTSAYRRSFMSASGIALGSARAGNVIGGGDWAADRLVPDILRAIEKGQPVVIRNPGSLRPWQHVLEPLSGYLMLAEKLAGENGSHFAEGWNFGPQDHDVRSVGWIVDRMTSNWGDRQPYVINDNDHLHEAGYLQLDNSKARRRLEWAPHWSLDTALAKIVEWHRGWLGGDDAQEICRRQIADFSSRTNLKDGK